MKRLLILPFLLWAGLLGAQQKYNAIVLEDEESFTLSSATSGTYTVHRSVRVFNDNGLPDALFHEYTDAFHTLTSFKGTLEREGAKPLKLKKDDLVMVSVASGLAEDGFLQAYEPSATYPFTVTYEYTVSYRKGVASFPAFIPVMGEKVKVEKASYSLQVPSGTAINYAASRVGEVRKEEGKADTYIWEVPAYEGYTDEVLMPSWREIVPYLIACPVDFVYAGVPGSQGTWEDVGRWCSYLRTGTSDLPEAFAEQLRQLTAGAGSDLEKIRILYDYLREHTRYVSIQLGIGGYKPFPASQVHKTGFGDCKGLSNYMQAMLDAVGIPSSYTLVNTNRRRFLEDYSGFGQMNHVMLCVPLPEKQDTLWLECTNPSLPLGYRHEDIADHDVVMTTPGGGVPTRVPAYADTLSRVVREMEIDLKEDGSAKVSVLRSLYLDETESWVHIRDWKPDTRTSRLTAGLSVQPQEVVLRGVKDNFRDYDGPGYCPWMELDYSFSTRQYATTGKDRIFVPANPYPQNASIQRGKRQNDLVCIRGGITRDRIRIHLPEGYTVESLPAPVSMDTEWGALTVRAEEKDGVVTILQELRIKPFRESPDHYDSFRTFLRAANKAYAAQIVLVSSK